ITITSDIEEGVKGVDFSTQMFGSQWVNRKKHGRKELG
ncbi:unnamed protein product, partial [marine sediment metagenome]